MAVSEKRRRKHNTDAALLSIMSSRCEGLWRRLACRPVELARVRPTTHQLLSVSPKRFTFPSLVPTASESSSYDESTSGQSSRISDWCHS